MTRPIRNLSNSFDRIAIGLARLALHLEQEHDAQAIVNVAAAEAEIPFQDIFRVVELGESLGVLERIDLEYTTGIRLTRFGLFFAEQWEREGMPTEFDPRIFPDVVKLARRRAHT